MDSGYGMVSRVAVPGGTEDWYKQTDAKMNLQSLEGIMTLTGRKGSAPVHEDLFKSTVKDFAQ